MKTVAQDKAGSKPKPFHRWRGKPDVWVQKNTTDILRWYQWCKQNGQDGEMRDIEARLVDAHGGLIFYALRRQIHSNRMPSGMYGNIEDDLTQCGEIALLRTIRLFDPDRGVKFSTYATRAIILDMMRFLKQFCMNTPGTMSEVGWKLVGDGKTAFARSAREGASDIQRILDKAELFLSPNELTVLLHRFGLNNHPWMTLQALGELLGVTKEAIRLWERQAIVKVRQALQGERCLLVATE